MSGSDDRTVRVWDVAGGIELMRYEGHGRPVRSVAITPDGRTAVSGAADGQIRIWRLPPASAAEQAAAVAAAARIAAPEAGSIFEPAQRVAAAPAAEIKPEGLPKPPGAAAQQRATAAVKKMFSAEFASAKSLDGKLELAERLLAEAGSYPPAFRYAMLDEARILAAASGYVGLAQRALTALAEQFDIDVALLTAETFELLGRQPLLPEGRQQLAVTSLAAAETALAGENYPPARRLLAVAAAASRKAPTHDSCSRSPSARAKLPSGKSCSIGSPPDKPRCKPVRTMRRLTWPWASTSASSGRNGRLDWSI